VIGRLEKTVLDCPDARLLHGEQGTGFRVLAGPACHPFCLAY
jgi:hypothetical protein